ncbi:hypothetical protein [Zoogloea sp.]|uniref:hypothetical protein n=1 Tax=Zoogloea sp. TaxID=49181 RepID=UPI0035B4F00B
MSSPKKVPLPADLVDLLYVNESRLAASDEEEFLNLYELETPPEEIDDEKMRAAYVAFLKKHGYEL